MKKIDISTAVSVLANLGVIVGIVFLAVEVQQNNRQLASQAEIALGNADQEIIKTLLENLDHAVSAASIAQGESLTSAQEVRLLLTSRLYFNNWQMKYLQNRTSGAGDLTTLETSIQGLFRNPENVGIPRRYFLQSWNGIDQIMDPDFVQFVQELIESE